MQWTTSIACTEDIRISVMPNAEFDDTIGL